MVKKIIVSCCVLIVFLVAMAVAGFVGVNLYYDPPLTPEAKKLMTGDASPAPEQNGYFAAIGLTAPKGKDAHQYGYAIYTAEQEAVSRTPKTVLPAYGESVDFENMAEIGRPQETPFEPHFVDRTKESLDCWLLTKAEFERKKKEKWGQRCMTGPDLLQHIKESDEHLKRYKKMLSYPRFYQVRTGLMQGHHLTTINDYYQARNIIWARSGQGDYAIQYWLDDLKFWNRAVVDQQNLATKAIINMLIAKSISALQTILESSPPLAQKYQAQLVDALRDPAVTQIKPMLASTYRAEYDGVAGMMNNLFMGKIFRLSFKPNATANDLAVLYDDVAALSDKTPENYAFELVKIRDNYNHLTNRDSPLKMFLYNPLGKKLYTVSPGRGILETSWFQAGERRVMTLYIMAMAQGIQGSKMPAFLSAVDKNLLDPYNGLPYRWDSNTREIYFEVTDEYLHPNRHAILYPEPVAVTPVTETAAGAPPN